MELDKAGGCKCEQCRRAAAGMEFAEEAGAEACACMGDGRVAAERPEMVGIAEEADFDVEDFYESADDDAEDEDEEDADAEFEFALEDEEDLDEYEDLDEDEDEDEDEDLDEDFEEDEDADEEEDLDEDEEQDEAQAMAFEAWAEEDESEIYEMLDDGSGEAFEVLHLKPRCPGVRRISVRKNRSGQEVLTREQSGELCLAARRALVQARSVLAVMNGIWAGRTLRAKRRRWKGNASVVRWFGRRILTRRQIRVTRRRVRRILRALERGVWFVVNQHQTGSKSYLCKAATNAYSWGGSRVFLCPNFFDLQSREQTRTIVHELVHRLGWAHARLPGVGPVSITASHGPRAQRLAQKKPMRARRNPVNFAWLYSEFMTPF